MNNHIVQIKHQEQIRAAIRKVEHAIKFAPWDRKTR